MKFYPKRSSRLDGSFVLKSCLGAVLLFVRSLLRMTVVLTVDVEVSVVDSRILLRINDVILEFLLNCAVS